VIVSGFGEKRSCENSLFVPDRVFVAELPGFSQVLLGLMGISYW